MDLDETLFTSKKRIEASRQGGLYHGTAISPSQLSNIGDNCTKLFRFDNGHYSGRIVYPLYPVLHKRLFASLCLQPHKSFHTHSDLIESDTIVIILTDGHYDIESIRLALTETFGLYQAFRNIYIFNYYSFFTPDKIIRRSLSGSGDRYLSPEQSKIGKIKYFLDVQDIKSCDVTIVDDNPLNLLAAQTFGYSFIDSSAADYCSKMHSYLGQLAKTANSLLSGQVIRRSESMPLLTSFNLLAIEDSSSEASSDGFDMIPDD
ncbi:hypothetical protein DC094_08245 [Pelagibaculum spongiae]|uniref:Uncharacterized protein n=2 Tax=Pelagibaculum spongiae TaxID=2080658 RepID=A0A2V1H2E8_9GAMM|nr:hypothetical protein DC094_08245 [Pelagibaculum spongiae]